MEAKSHVAILTDLQREARRIFAQLKAAAKEHGVTDFGWLQDRVVVTLVRSDGVERCFIYRVGSGHLLLSHGIRRAEADRSPQLDQTDPDAFTEAFENALSCLLSEHLDR